MKRRRGFLIYPLLIFLITGPACGLAARLGQAEEPTPTRPRRYVVLPAPSATAVPGLANLALPEPAAPPLNRSPRPTATPTPDNFAKFFAELLQMFAEPAATATQSPRLVMLPTIAPTPTATATPLPTFTPLPTDTPMPTVTPIPLPTDTPLPLPTDTPLPPVSAPVQAPPPTPAVAASSFTSPIATPVSASASSPAESAPAESGYDFLVAEFYNSPTTNSFIVIYVAIVDPNEIPIGDMKIVGTRLDHNLTYESPLSTWHYEGYNAPGEVIKSGNVKFEPPGGIETTNWVLHLEDANGERLSEDVPFDTDQNNKQWYFIKFKRKF
jgi:hypothetical protein